MNQSIHTIDLLLHFLGEARSVYALMRTAAHERIEVEDVLTATILFKNDALCTLACTTAAYPGYSSRIELFGTEGSAVLEDDLLARRHFKNGREPSAAVPGEEGDAAAEPFRETPGADPAALSGEAHRAQLYDMISAVREGREPAVNGLDGRRALELVTAIYRSARERKAIDLA